MPCLFYTILLCTLQETDGEKFEDDYFLGSGGFSLNPIRTSSQPSFQKRSTFFDESVPSTPMTNAGFSPTYTKDGLLGRGPFFDGSSRYDSLNLHDSGLFPQRGTLGQFDSMSSTKDFDASHGFPSFDDSDPFRTSFGETPRKGSDIWSETPRSTVNFGETPKSTFNFGETPKSTYNFGDTSNSAFNWGETPRSSSDPWGETPRKATDSWGETPRRGSDLWGEETPRRGSDNWSAF